MANGSARTAANAIPVFIVGGGSGPTPPLGAAYLGYQQISAATLATAQMLTVPVGATYAYIISDVGNVTWLPSGVPTASSGMPLYVGQSLTLSSGLSTAEFILKSGTPVLNILYYG